MRVLRFPPGRPGARGPRMRLLGVVAIAGALITLGSSAASAGSSPRPLTQLTWRHDLKQLQLPGRGCFTASYPTVAWRRARCVTAPLIPYRPVQHSPSVRGVRRDVRPQTVGDGTDYSAQVTGAPIFDASGTFDTGSTVTSVGNFSLQLNSAPFTSPACSTALVPAVCQGWQQYIYSSTFNVVFMQYWLLNYNTTCPAGWMTSGGDCFKNSTASTLTGGPLTAANLASAVFNGIATSSNDAVSLSDGTLAAAVSNSDSVLDLSPNWTTVEFAVVGDGGGSQANFGAGSTLAVRTSVDNGSTVAPSCVLDGFTAETNNLDLAPTPAITGGVNPAVESIQNATGGVPSCASAHGDGDTHLMTFGNLFYDFQAQGDFELASTSPNFLVENRQVSGAPSWPNAAVNQAVAARVGTSKVAVCATTRTPLYVNGKATTLKPGGQLSLPGGAAVSLDPTGTTYLIQDGSGNSVTAAVSSTTSPQYVNASLGLGRWPEPVQGLLANAAGTTNPTAIQANNGGVLTAPYNFSQFYSTYGKSWRVTAKQDLLTPCGKPLAASNPKNTFYTSNLPPAIARQAQDICQNDGVKAAPLLDACTIDEAVLGKNAPLVYRTLPSNVTVGQISPPKGGNIRS
jgi:hypothetical protein